MYICIIDIYLDMAFNIDQPMQTTEELCFADNGLSDIKWKEGVLLTEAPGQKFVLCFCKNNTQHCQKNIQDVYGCVGSDVPGKVVNGVQTYSKKKCGFMADERAIRMLYQNKGLLRDDKKMRFPVCNKCNASYLRLTQETKSPWQQAYNQIYFTCACSFKPPDKRWIIMFDNVAFVSYFNIVELNKHVIQKKQNKSGFSGGENEVENHFFDPDNQQEQ